MDTFTIILMIIGSAIMMIYLYKQYKKEQARESKLTWPREISPCPNYWVDLGNGKCKNIHDVGTCPTNKGSSSNPEGIFHFDTSYFNGEAGDLKKCRWSKRCQSPWEGIDNLCA